MPSSDTITIYRGQDVELPFAMDPVENITGWTILFTLRGGSDIVEVAAEMVDSANGTFSVTLPDTATDLLAAGRYDYDVWRVDADVEQPIAVGTLVLLTGPRDTTVTA